MPPSRAGPNGPPDTVASPINEHPDDGLHSLQGIWLDSAEAPLEPAHTQRFDLLAEGERDVPQTAFGWIDRDVRRNSPVGSRQRHQDTEGVRCLVELIIGNDQAWLWQRPHSLSSVKYGSSSSSPSPA